MLTVARGSSHHPARDVAYLVMARLDRLVNSLPTSLVTMQQSRLLCVGLVSMVPAQRWRILDLVKALPRGRGLDPARQRHLAQITQTHQGGCSVG